MNNSKKLYLHNTYLFESQATIVDKAQDEKGQYILLDQTIFHPQGGGQPSDQGLIKGNNFELYISHVKQFGNEVRHYTSNCLDEAFIGNSIICIIDQERRILNARYHTAEHLIGNIVKTVFPSLKIIKAHAFPKEGRITFEGLEKIDLEILMKELSIAIQSCIPITTFEIDPVLFEKKFYKLTSTDQSDKIFQVTQIGDYFPIPCGGTHLSNTSEIEGIKIRKIKTKDEITSLSYDVI
jgi:alanyl-tRNA synthetase